MSLLPRLKKLDDKKIVIGDNLSSHINVAVLEACTKFNIAFIALPPNSTHLTQPLDVAYFRPMKTAWRRILTHWKETGKGRKLPSLPKELFPELLNELLVKMEVKDAENMKSGFRKSGIYPLDRNQVLARLPGSVDGAAEAVSASFIEHLVQMRGEDKDAPRRKRLKVSVVPGRSISADDVADLLESNKKKKSTKKAVKTTSASTSAETGNGDNPEPTASADTGSRTDSDDINPQTSDAHLLAQIHEDETAADVEPDDDDEHSSCPDSLSSSVVSENSLDIPSNDIPVKANSGVVSVNVGDFVVVNYDENFYPGTVTGTKKSGAEVNAMVSSGSNWKWPKQEDKLFYYLRDIVMVISDPVPIGKRGIFRVVEMDKFV